MTTEEKEFINIEDGLYDNLLRQALYVKKHLLGYETPVISSVLKLARWDFILEDPKEFFNDEERTVLSELPDLTLLINKELLARWLDYVMLWYEKPNPIQLKTTALAYIAVFENTGDSKYYLRALEVGKLVKQIFKDRFEEFYSKGSMIIRRNRHPFWQNRILSVLTSFSTYEKCQSDFEQYLWDQHTAFLDESSFSEARKTLDCLKTLKLLTPNEYKIRRAVDYQAEGDHWVEKIQSGYSLNVADIYVKAFRELHSVGGCDDLRDSIAKKIKEQQLVKNKFLRTHGVNLIPKTDFPKLQLHLALKGITDFDSAFKELLDMAVISNEAVKAGVINIKKNSFYANEFANSVFLSEQGSNVGFLSGDDAIQHKVRMQLREKLLAKIQVLKFVMDLDSLKDQKFIAGLMPESSPFVPSNRAGIFFHGIFSGFRHDFQAAAYLLVPQIENAFKVIAETNQILVTRYQDKEQFDNTMGGCLLKIKPILSEDIFLELQNFLTETNGQNFRNKLLHGQSDPGMAQHYGKYVWWLVLKMIFRPDELIIKKFKQQS